MDDQQLRQAQDPLADYEEPGPRHPANRRLVALVVALFLAAITAMTMGYSLFKAPPTPDRTRPLPRVIPRQGAVR